MMLPLEEVKIGSEHIPLLTNPKPQEYLFDLLQKGEGFDGLLIPQDNREMNEMWAIVLTTFAEDCHTNTRKWNAGLLNVLANGDLNERDNFEAVQLITEGRRFSFETNSIQGLWYEFEGEFTRPGRYFALDEIVLRGTMKKIRKGKVIVAFTSDFTYRNRVCQH